MIPNICNILLNTITPKNTGAKYFITITNIRFLLNFEVNSISLEIGPSPTNHPNTTHVARPASRSNREFAIKSIKSRTEKPNILTKSKAPYPSDAGIPKIHAEATTIKTAGILLTLHISHKVDINTSATEINDVNAAKATRIKNAPPITCPNGILRKTFGNVINIKPAP